MEMNASPSCGEFRLSRGRIVHGRLMEVLPFQQNGIRRAIQTWMTSFLIWPSQSPHQEVVTGDSGFCVAMGFVALHKLGVHRQFLVKKHHYWPTLGHDQCVHDAKPLGYTEMFVQTLKDMCFYAQCTCNSDYVTNIMSTHGVMVEIGDPGPSDVEVHWWGMEVLQVQGAHQLPAATTMPITGLTMSTTIVTIQLD